MATFTWVGGSSGNTATDSDPSVAANWTESGAPSATGTDDLVFKGTATHSCLFDSNFECNSIKIEPDCATGRAFTVDDCTVTLKANTNALLIQKEKCVSATGAAIIKFNGHNGTSTKYVYFSNTTNMQTEPLGMFSNESSRSAMVFAFFPSSSCTILMEDGVYPTVIVSSLQANALVVLSPTYCASGSTNTYGFVDILSFSSNCRIEPKTYTENDLSKKFVFEGLLVLDCDTSPDATISLNRNKITANWGFSTVKFTPTATNFYLPVTGDTNFGHQKYFSAKYFNIEIGKASNSTHRVNVRNNVTLYCNSLRVDSGAKLYAEGVFSDMNCTEIHTVQRPNILGDWNYVQVADGVYRSRGSPARIPVTSGGTGLDRVSELGILYGDAQNTLDILPFPTSSPAGKVLAINSGGDGFEWSSTAGGGGNAFDSIAVSGQTSLAASAGDDLTLVAAGGMTITTNATTDTITFSSADNNDNTQNSYAISCVDGDNTDEEKIRLTQSGAAGSATDDIVLEAGTGLSIARDGDKITFANTVSDTNTNQLTTFTLIGTTNTTPTTVNHNDTITIAAGTGITTTSTSDGTITIASTVTDTNTQLDNAGVIGKVLTGLNVSGTTSDVAATDTIVEAIGHMEKRIRLNDDKVTNTDTNTNQLTTFNIGVDTNTNSTTIAHGETLTFTGGTGISTETTADGTITFTNTVSDTNTFRIIQVDTAGDGSADKTLETSEALVLKKGTNITLSEALGVVTIASTDTNTTTTADVRTALGATMPSNTLQIGDGSTTTTFPGSIVVTGTTTTNNVETISTSGGIQFESNATGVHTDKETLLTGVTGLTSDITVTLPSSTGTIALQNENTSGTAAGLSATLAIGSGGTGATNSNAWLNSRITTSADGSLNYDATTAVAVNHDNLAGFVAAEHYDWSADLSGTASIDGANVRFINIIDNEETDETVYPVFVDGATGSQALETETKLSYKPDTGVLTSTAFAGNLTGDVTGTIQTAAQTNITSVGTLTSLTMTSPLTINHAGTDLFGDIIGPSNRHLRFVLRDNGDADSFYWRNAAGSNIMQLARTGALTVSGTITGDLTGDVTGNVTGNVSGSSGSCTGNSATATTATNVVVTDNESTNEDNAIVFAAGADVDGSTSIGLESDGDLTYNPSTGKVSTGMLQLTSTNNEQLVVSYDSDDKFALHVGTDRAKFMMADTTGTDLNTVMVFQENGTSTPRVGIHELSPTAPLHVGGEIKTGSLTSSGNVTGTQVTGSSYVGKGSARLTTTSGFSMSTAAPSSFDCVRPNSVNVYASTREAFAGSWNNGTEVIVGQFNYGDNASLETFLSAKVHVTIQIDGSQTSAHSSNYLATYETICHIKDSTTVNQTEYASLGDTTEFPIQWKTLTASDGNDYLALVVVNNTGGNVTTTEAGNGAAQIRSNWNLIAMDSLVG